MNRGDRTDAAGAERAAGDRPAGRLVLITGGARSGKSRFAESLAAVGRQPVVYLATAEAGDAEMRARIAEHQRRRPAAWRTVEARAEVGPALAGLGGPVGTVLLDDLGLLVTNHLLALTGDGELIHETEPALRAAVAEELARLVESQRTGGWDLVVVTNEVGLGVVPATPLGRLFRDALGWANQELAARADAVFLVMAGLPLRLKPACACGGPALT